MFHCLIIDSGMSPPPITLTLGSCDEVPLWFMWTEGVGEGMEREQNSIERFLRRLRERSKRKKGSY